MLLAEKKKTLILVKPQDHSTSCSGMQRESSTKKIPLTERLHKDVDVACIQEIHPNTNPRFSIRGCQTFRLDREGRHKGGVLILVQNNIAASDFKVDTNKQAETHGVNITVDKSAMSILKLYCPLTKISRCKIYITVPLQNCLAVGDFNSHSTSWGYSETYRRGDKVGD